MTIVSNINMKFCTVIIYFSILISKSAASGGFSFASYYEDHMVLQQAPAQANIWGYANILDVGKSVQIAVFNNTALMSTYSVKVFRGTGQLHDTGLWRVMLKPLPVGGPYRLKFTLGTRNIFLNDVLSGDVFICSGQSNMQFTIPMSYSHKEELAMSTNYTEVRIFSASREETSIPLFDLRENQVNWSRASPESLGGAGTFTYFSAVCWLYGRMLYDEIKIPIGLIDSNWGGTRVEAWSSPDALKQCSHQELMIEDPNDFSHLWNAMIHPMLNMTIKGVVWYQGEENQNKKSPNYDCMFQAMINDWRAKFFAGSMQQTSKLFPFGFVQLAPNDNDPSITFFPSIRWQQTYNVGHVPNKFLENVFMAVAIDLPDFISPFSPIHPRDKSTVSRRLVNSALNIIYGKPIKFQGPFPTNIIMDKNASTIDIVYDNGTTYLGIRSLNGFELCCTNSPGETCDPNIMTNWISQPIKQATDVSISLEYTGCGSKYVSGIRYIWRCSPCLYKACPVYSIVNELPAPPFFFDQMFPNGTKEYYPYF